MFNHAKATFTLVDMFIKKQIEISNKDFTTMPKTNKQKSKNANKRKANAKPQLDKNKKTKSAEVSSEKPTIVAKDNDKNKKPVSVLSEKPRIVAEKENLPTIPKSFTIKFLRLFLSDFVSSLLIVSAINCE